MADGTATSPTVLDGAEEIRAAVGRHLGYSDWHVITQERVNQFADATGDHQWIHVDVDRAAKESPYGGTIAHGYLTMSMSNELVPQIVKMGGFAMGINYGVDKVRFPAAVQGRTTCSRRRRDRRGHRRAGRDPGEDAHHDRGGGLREAGVRDRVAGALDRRLTTP